ncbi:ATP-grasp domain-containing protein [Brachybacterium sacelli]|uniref:Biotin carboxylase n=1 Tax=Brachybacterium sacelli TaxID=173364 RepID=A0ABS4WZF3_9MICO|nr:ATP-grasp domain-containing protein [Brachybacterium sacelli]MBP2381585.1 biotin carboxylase [Brachybacterium sacelli]
MTRHVFLLGLDHRNLEILRRLPGAAELEFHRLLSLEELQGAHIDMPTLLHRAEEELDTAGVAVDAIASFWDFPMVTMVPILCARRGLPSADLLAVLRCEHKYWARVVQRDAIDEIPGFGLLDLDIPAPVLPERMQYPVWIKPVNAASSAGAFKLEDDADLRRHLPDVRAVIDRLGPPFQQVLDMAELPGEIADVGGRACLVEEAVSGHQMTLEGFSHDGEVVVYGVVDSFDYPGTSSFQRYQYPSSAPWGVRERIGDISRRVVEASGLRESTFNIEFFWDEATDAIRLLEVNARHSQEHAPLFEMVDGASNHQAMIDIAFGRTPQLPHGAGGHAVAAKWFLRHFGDGIVRSVPTGEQIARLEQELPGTSIHIRALPEEQLSQRFYEDGYSSILATVYTGGADEEEIAQAYRRCAQTLEFEIDEVRTP